MIDWIKGMTSTITDSFGNAIGSVNMWEIFFELLIAITAIMTTFLVLIFAVGLIVMMTTRSEHTIMATKQYMKTALQAWLILSFTNIWFDFCFSLCVGMVGHW